MALVFLSSPPQPSYHLWCTASPVFEPEGPFEDEDAESFLPLLQHDGLEEEHRHSQDHTGKTVLIFLASVSTLLIFVI